MSNTKSILFFLNDYLDIYTIDSGSQEITKIFAKGTETHLNLADHMQQIWVETIDPISSQTFYLILGPRASFTDTRMIYMWLKTSEQFSQTSFYIHKTKTPIHFEGFEYDNIAQYIQPIKENNSQEIIYSREPRIGK